nr:oligomycin resistance atp-dependent permease yor1 [Quercus suber]
MTRKQQTAQPSMPAGNGWHEPAMVNDESRKNSESDDELQKAGPISITVEQSVPEQLDSDLRTEPPQLPEGRIVSREYQAGFLSVLYFQWVSPLLSAGYRKPLELSDIWSVNPTRSVDVLTPRLEKALQRRKAHPGKLDPLLMAIVDTFKKEIIIGAICQLTAGVLQVLTPFMLRYLIQFADEAYVARYQGGVPPSVGKGVGIAIGISSMQLVQSMCTSHFIYRGMIFGGQARSTLIACVFEKAMKLSGRAKVGIEGVDSKEGWGNGRINNLMSTDTSRIDQAAANVHRCWVSPIQVLLTLVLLCVNLGYSALAGFGLVCVLVPLLGRAIRSLMSRRRIINKVTDQRVQLTQEIVSSIRFIKLFSWETSFLDRLFEIRKYEIFKIFMLVTIRNGILAVAMVTPVFASIITFITYGLSGHQLRAAPVFSSLAMFGALSVPLEWLPTAISQVVDAYASLKRISTFLDAEEHHEDADLTRDEEREDLIRIDDASFTWEQNTSQELARKAGSTRSPTEQNSHLHVDGMLASSEDPPVSEESLPFQIQDINLAVGRHELLAVIGSVGSGKSSLLSAIAGDMRKVSGSIAVGASRALCPQYAWVQNATIRQNIIFGKPFVQEQYDAVIDAAGLRPDLEMLPHGDQTEIGERGITVSGGQKQRLNIARAIYFDADIVIMDDPLSAVDAHVGRHIMDNAICGLLKGKCRILATHQLHVLHRVDRIVWMKDGRVHKAATFKELMDNDGEFQEMMAATANENRAKSQDTDTEQTRTVSRAVELPALALMQQEERGVKAISWDVYRDYVKATGSSWNLVLVISIVLLMQGTTIVNGLWLSWWTSDRFHLSLGQYIGIYAGIGGVQACFMFSFAAACSFFGTRASRNILHTAVTRVLHAPVSFFDTTPVGRIMNRFSKDIDTLDNQLSDNLRMLLWIMASVTSVFCLTIAYYYYFAIALVPLLAIFIATAAYYRASAREIKRHEAVLRSIVFSRFGEAITGVATIRAYGMEKQFNRSIAESLDSMDGAYFLLFAVQRWLSTRVDTVGNLMVFVVGILIVTSRFTVNPSIAGVILSYLLSIVSLIQLSVRQFAEVENNMNSAERLHHYSKHLEQEPPSLIGKMPASWPQKGEITFSDVRVRYRPGLPLVLQGLSLHIRPGERIGIVGRTGAGKSTIMSTLFRLVELSEGSIIIDGIDISTMDLQDLRSQLAVIPQDPTLFRGTIRSNLDPANQHQDPDLWNALRQAGLIDLETSDETRRLHLDTPVEDEGLNFSLGQRQLLALARALIRGSQIIVCDEATSSVDFDTDQKIQRTMATAFKGRTLICIAHRLKTIIGYDRIVVMDAGKVAELDRPIRLYDQRGVFRSLCDRSGIKREDFEINEAAI